MIILVHTFSLDLKFCWTKTFLNQNFCWGQNFFSKIFWTRFILPNISLDQILLKGNCFWTNISFQEIVFSIKKIFYKKMSNNLFVPKISLDSKIQSISNEYLSSLAQIVSVSWSGLSPIWLIIGP